MTKYLWIYFTIVLSLMLSMLFASIAQAAECNLQAPTIEFVKSLEGYDPVAYKDSAGVWTIGYGWTHGVKEGDVISRQLAEEFLIKYLGYVNVKVNEYVAIPLTDNECGALHSFVYNIGIDAFRKSDMRVALNNNLKQAAAKEFDRWIYIKGPKVSKGLVIRRRLEKELFLGDKINAP